MKHLWKNMVETLGIVTAVMILSILPSPAWSAENIDIRHLVQGKKVIPVYCRIGHWEISDIKLPDLIVTNIFPVKGDLQMAFLPLSYIHHRASASQEFAMDLVGANQNDAASFTDISRPKAKKLSDYSVWGREVLAMGNGVVVETGDKFPEERMSDPARFTEPGYATSLIKELIPKIGWTNAVAGNYVVIDHENGEFSVYCHLQESSLRVKPGDTVNKGMAIGKVGNTGNSGPPNLHFQLMDSRSFMTANGLPMMFENVPAQVMIAEFPVKGNTLSFSDSIFSTVP